MQASNESQSASPKCQKADLFKKGLFIVLLAIAAICPGVTPPMTLFSGIVFAFLFGTVFAKQVKKGQKFLLQASVVGLGFGMNVTSALKSGKDGMVMTIFSVVIVMLLGWVVGRLLKVDKRTSYLISSGTAICGGSAIAAVGPLVDADDDQMSVSLGTIFLLNALALFLFPPLGHLFGMNAAQFGEWAAIAIHDTSSVVGAGAAFDAAYMEPGTKVAWETATLVKCTRALWILPLAFATMLLFRRKGKKVAIPWFIFLFALAMVINTYTPFPESASKFLVLLAKHGINATLFLIGSSLTPAALKACGVRPLIQGVLLWILIGVISYASIMLF